MSADLKVVVCIGGDWVVASECQRARRLRNWSGGAFKTAFFSIHARGGVAMPMWI